MDKGTEMQSMNQFLTTNKMRLPHTLSMIRQSTVRAYFGWYLYVFEAIAINSIYPGPRFMYIDSKMKYYERDSNSAGKRAKIFLAEPTSLSESVRAKRIQQISPCHGHHQGRAICHPSYSRTLT